MILYINDRLNMWADWRGMGRPIAGLGYPSQCAFSRLTPSRGEPCQPIINEEAVELDAAVCALAPNLKAVVLQFYLHAGTAETHAHELQCSTTSLYSRLHAAHVQIMEYLQVGPE